MNERSRKKFYRIILPGSLLFGLIILVFILPLDWLEYLSVEIVGEPPINGRTWAEGVMELGGDISMRLLAVWGLLIIFIAATPLISRKVPEKPSRSVSKGEVGLFLASTGVFFIVNFLIGYAWWDPDGFLGMGSLFFPSILSLVVLGMMPLLARRLFDFKSEDLATSREHLPSVFPFIIAVAFGYGLVSTVWHCCSFFNSTMYFFFFVTKLAQLWGVSSFFFGWGLPMFVQVTKKPRIALILTALLFGFCYPWHTLGFAFTFVLFGFLIGILTLKTDSYLPGLILLYFAYIFHAGLPWHGPQATLYLIHPLSVGVLTVTLILAKKQYHARE